MLLHNVWWCKWDTGVEISLKVLLIMNSSKVNLKHRNESQLTEKMEWGSCVKQKPMSSGGWEIWILDSSSWFLRIVSTWPCTHTWQHCDTNFEYNIVCQAALMYISHFSDSPSPVDSKIFLNSLHKFFGNVCDQ